MDSAWDRLLDLVDHLAATPGRSIGPDVEQEFADLASHAQLDGDVDGELHVDDVARWLTGLTTAHRAVRTNHPEIDPDTELAGLRRIVTRWLHPARPR